MPVKSELKITKEEIVVKIGIEEEKIVKIKIEKGMEISLLKYVDNKAEIRKEGEEREVLIIFGSNGDRDVFSIVFRELVGLAKSRDLLEE